MASTLDTYFSQYHPWLFEPHRQLVCFSKFSLFFIFILEKTFFNFSPVLIVGGIKVLVAGPWYNDLNSNNHYRILFDNIPVATELVQNGLLRCFSPKHDPGLITLQVSCNDVIISNSVIFEYRHSTNSHNNNMIKTTQQLDNSITYFNHNDEILNHQMDLLNQNSLQFNSTASSLNTTAAIKIKQQQQQSLVMVNLYL